MDMLIEAYEDRIWLEPYSIQKYYSSRHWTGYVFGHLRNSTRQMRLYIGKQEVVFYMAHAAKKKWIRDTKTRIE